MRRSNGLIRGSRQGEPTGNRIRERRIPRQVKCNHGQSSDFSIPRLPSLLILPFSKDRDNGPKSPGVRCLDCSHFASIPKRSPLVNHFQRGINRMVPLIPNHSASRVDFFTPGQQDQRLAREIPSRLEEGSLLPLKGPWVGRIGTDLDESDDICSPAG